MQSAEISSCFDCFKGHQPIRRHYFLIPSGKINLAGDPLEGTTTKDRLDEAVRFWETMPDEDKKHAIFIPSGGKLRPDHVQAVSDAELMRNYLIQHCKVPDEHILLESQAADTFENVRFGLGVAHEHAKSGKWYGTLHVFSDVLHLKRFKPAICSFRFPRNAEWQCQGGLELDQAEYHQVAKEYSLAERIQEGFFFWFVHLLDPLGRWHPLALLSRWLRRRSGQQP